MQLVVQIARHSIDETFGCPANLKFPSCMKRFAGATPDNAIFLQALEKR